MFFKEVNEIDLGETTIANIFIDIFMPMANGLYVKVYLLGIDKHVTLILILNLIIIQLLKI